MNFDQVIRRSNWYGIKRPVAALISLPLVNPAARWLASFALSKHALQRLPYRADQAEYILASGERVALLNPLIDHVAKDLLWGAGAPTCKAFAHILRYVESHGGRTFVDIGAYSGLFALVAARSGMRSLAFEILPENYLMVVLNVIANDLIEKVEVKLCGLSDSAGSIVMPLATRSVSHPSSISLAADYVEGISVPVVTLDRLGLDGPMLWKLDVEGFEAAVLRGGLETIRRWEPDIICEILPGCDTQMIGQALDGYRFLHALPHGFEERELQPDPSYRDWLFTRSPLSPTARPMTTLSPASLAAG